MRNWTSQLVAVAAVCLAVGNAVIREDPAMPRYTKSVTMGKGTQAEHTLDSRGRFKHPFKNQPSSVQHIHYPESNTFSTKLHRTKAGARNRGHELLSDKSRVIGSGTRKTEHLGFWDMFKPQMATYTDNLTNYDNLNYLGELYMGTPLQAAFNVVWDTGSGELILESSDCSGCNDAVFELEDSSTFAYLAGQPTSTLEYLDGTSLKGTYATDRACPTTDESICAADFQFLAIYQQNGLGQEEDGILGMWSGNVSGVDNTGFYFDQLVADTGIDSQFSFYLTGLDGQSYIDFGTPNTAIMTDTPIYIPSLAENEWWAAEVTGFRWDATESDQNEYALTEADYGITDTGSSCIIGPTDDVQPIVNNILSRMDTVYYDRSWGGIFPCSEATDLPGFQLLFGGYWFDVLPEDYLIEITTDGTYCGLCIEAMDYPEWILGDAFMRGFYNIHDTSTYQMGFTPFTGSSKTLPTVATTTPSGSLPDVDVDYIYSIWSYVLIGTLVAVGAGIIYLVLRRFSIIGFQPMARTGLKAARKTVPGAKQEDTTISLIYLQ